MSNKRLNKTIEKAFNTYYSRCCGGRFLWLDAYNNLVYDEVSPTIKTTIQTSCMNFIMEKEETNKELKICAMRGRSDGEWHESEHEQRIECREDGVTNTITGVSKDNMVAEPIEQEDPVVLGWSRGNDWRNMTRHPVSVANCVTAGKRDNTQNYVKEQYVLNACKDGVAATLKSENMRASEKCITEPTGGFAKMGVLETQNSLPFRVRRLTERELFRLMDVSEDDIDKIQDAGISKTQQAKMAGNSIVVGVLYAIFYKMFINTDIEKKQLELF